jgi:hypothetical protein
LETLGRHKKIRPGSRRHPGFFSGASHLKILKVIKLDIKNRAELFANEYVIINNFLEY